MSNKVTTAERLRSRTRKLKSGCWKWTGTTDPQGYGLCRDGSPGRVYRRAHRLAYLEYVGPIPSGQVVRHKCDNPGCVNPGHLECGTPADNNADTARRGRTARGARHPLAKLTDAKARSIHRRSASGEACASIARSLGISNVTCCRIRRGVMWKHVKGATNVK